jgi:hypothetical protein
LIHFAFVATVNAQLFVLSSTPSTGIVSEFSATTGAAISPALLSGATGTNNAVAMAIHGDNLFILTYGGNGIVEYTTAGAIVNPAFASGLNHGVAIAVSNNNLFVLTSGPEQGGSVAEYDATTGASINPMLIPGGTGYANGVATVANTNDLFVMSSTVATGVVSEFDATTGTAINPTMLAGAIGTNNAVAMAINGNDIFILTSTGGLGEYTTSGAIVNPLFESGINHGVALAVSDNDLFVLTSGPEQGGSVAEYDATTGATINPMLLPDGTGADNGVALVVSLPEPGALSPLLIGIAGLFARRPKRRG